MNVIQNEFDTVIQEKDVWLDLDIKVLYRSIMVNVLISTLHQVIHLNHYTIQYNNQLIEQIIEQIIVHTSRITAIYSLIMK